MHESCPVCSQVYDPEPGYYFGAMYVSYALNVAIMVTVWVASLILFGDALSIWWVVGASMLTGVGLSPLTFRIARRMWIAFFVKYRAPESDSRMLEASGENA